MFDLLLTWFAYSILGWIFLVCLRTYHIRTFASVFLCGALYGWMAEGVIVTTMFGSPDNPFPISISWTGLAWHALLTVGVGWYATLAALNSSSTKRMIMVVLLIGLAWGLWAVFWPRELGDTCDTTPMGFLLHSICFGFLLPLAWLGIRYSGGVLQTWGNRAWYAMVTLVVVAVCVRIWVTPFAGGILPVLLGVVFYLLNRSRNISDDSDTLIHWMTIFPVKGVLWLIPIPLFSIITYSFFRIVDFMPPTNIILYLITTPVGFIVFGWSLWRILSHKVSGAIHGNS